MSYVSEAHLPPSSKSLGLVKWMRTGKRRSRLGWAVFVGLIILNETRGAYVVAEILKAAGLL